MPPTSKLFWGHIRGHMLKALNQMPPTTPEAASLLNGVTIMLTDPKCKNAKPKDKAYKLYQVNFCFAGCFYCVHICNLYR